MADEVKHSNKAIVWLFGGRRRALLLFALSILMILNFANQENWAVQAKGLSGIISWLASIVGNDLTLLIIRVFALAIFFILILLIFSAYSKIAVKRKSYESSSIYHFLILLFLIALTVGLFWQKGFHSTTPLFWIIAIFVLWTFLMILSYPVLLPIESDIYDLARLRALFLAKGPISLLGRFRKAQEHLLLGHVRNFLIASALVIFSASYKKDYAVAGATPLKNLTDWTLNGTTWLKDSTIGLLIDRSKIPESSPEIIRDKVLNYISISGGDISNITIQNATFHGQMISNVTSKIPIGLSNNETYSNIIINQSAFMDNSISDATLKDAVLNNLSYAEEIVKKSLLHSPVDLILGNISTANATINNIILKNITVLNATINSSETSGNLTASIDIIKNVTLKNATILDASFYKTALDNISFLNSSIAGTLPIIPGSSEIIVGSTSTVSHLLVSFAEMMDIILSNFWSNLSSIFLLWAVIEILAIAWAARKRMVIEDFDDGTTEKKDGKLVSRLLAMKISDLNTIYSKANETRSVPTSTGNDQPLQASIKIGDVSDLLGSITTSSELKVGPITVPTNLLASVMERIVNGPNLTGSINKEKNEDNKDILLLSAYVHGGGIPYRSWQVRRELNSSSKSQENSTPTETNPPKETISSQPSTSQSQVALEIGTLIFDEALNELACRIFTDLVFNPSQRELVRWKATMKTGEGLRAYRDCLRSRMNKPLKLKEAERKFVEALAEDEMFNLVYYNLGVIYKELNKLDAAEKAFIKSIEITPEQWEGYYALGMTLFEKIPQRERSAMIQCKKDNNLREQSNKHKDQYKKIIDLCNQALNLNPESNEDMAKILDLKGLAQSLYEMDLCSSIGSNKEAVIRSYWALYESELKGGDSRDIKIIITICLDNLACAYAYKEDIFRVKVIATEAISVSPSDKIARDLLEPKWIAEKDGNNIEKEDNKIFPDKIDQKVIEELIKLEELSRDNSKKLNDIRESLKDVLELKGDVIYKKSLYEDKEKQKLRDAQNNMREIIKLNEIQKFKDIIKKYEDINREILCIIYDFENGEDLGSIEEYCKEGIKHIDELIVENKSIYPDICCKLGEIYIKKDDTTKEEYIKAENYYNNAKISLEDDRLKMNQLDLWHNLSLSLFRQESNNTNLKAQIEMEEATSFDPLNPYYRFYLAHIFYDLERFEEAKREWENALYLNPDEPRNRFNLGKIFLQQSYYLKKPELRKQAYGKAANYLEGALELFRMDQTFYRAITHYWLGQLYAMLKRYDYSLTNLRSASILISDNKHQKEKLSIDWRLGQVYMKDNRYEKGGKQLEAVIRDAKELLKTGTKMLVDCNSTLVDNPKSLGCILIMAYLDLAFAYADQPAILDKARKMAYESRCFSCALEALELEKAKKVENNKAQEDDEILECKAEYYVLLGVIAYKQSLLEIESREALIEEAINHLKDSIHLKQSLRGYLYLAKSYMLKIDANRDRINELQSSPKQDTAPENPDLEKFKILLEELQKNLKQRQDMNQSEIKDYLDKISSLQSIQNLIEKNKTLDDKINKSLLKIEEDRVKIYLEKENKTVLNQIKECYNYLTCTDLNEDYSMDIQKIKPYLDDSQKTVAPQK